MNDENVKFFAKYCLGEVSPKDFSDWAVNCLEKGIDTKNIRILASMFNAQYTSEVETYFIRSLDDLNRDFPKKEKVLPEYAELVAKEILSKKIKAIEGANEIYKVYRNLGYEPELANCEYLNMKMHPETYEDLVYERKGVEYKYLLEESIIEEAAKMIYGKKTTVVKVKDETLFDFAEDEERGVLSKLWKKIF